MQRIGIFGGAFDPIHIGHIILAQDIWENVPLDKILFLVNYVPPHKNVQAPFHHRFEMVKLAVEKFPYFEASDFEEKNQIVPSYTYNVISKMKELMPDAEFYLIIGTDQYNSLDKWYKKELLLEMVELIVLRRPGHELKDFGKKVFFVDERLIDVSSTEIRERVKEGKVISHLVPETVEKYIRENHLYL